MAAAPAQSEGDVNSTPLRSAWQREHLDEPSRALLARDSAAFLHQSVSTPCLAPIVRAEGLYIEDMAGRRYMDFHGNNVHHLGHGHPEVIAAIKRQLDALSFAPRRFAPLRAVELAEALGARFQALTGQKGRVLFTTGGSDAVEVALEAGARRHRPLQDAEFLGRLPRRRLRLHPASVASRCSARADSGRCCRAANTSRPSAATAAPTATRSMPGPAAAGTVPAGLRGDGALRAGARR